MDLSPTYRLPLVKHLAAIDSDDMSWLEFYPNATDQELHCNQTKAECDPNKSVWRAVRHYDSHKFERLS